MPVAQPRDQRKRAEDVPGAVAFAAGMVVLLAGLVLRQMPEWRTYRTAAEQVRG